MPTTKPPSSRVVQEAVLIIEVTLGRHIEAEVAAHNRHFTSRSGPRWMGARYGLGMAAPSFRGKQLVAAVQQEITPIVRRPLDTAKGYTAAAKLDELLVVLGALCMVLGCSPLGGQRLRELRVTLGRLLAA